MNTSELVDNLKTLGLTVVYCDPEQLLISNDYSESDLERILDQLRSPTCPFPRSALLETIVTSLLETLQKKDSSLPTEMTMDKTKQDVVELPPGYLYSDSNFERVGLDKEEFSVLYQQHRKLVVENYELRKEYNLMKNDENLLEERNTLEQELENVSKKMVVLSQKLRDMTSKLYQ